MPEYTCFQRLQLEMLEAGYRPPYHPLEMSEYCFGRFRALERSRERRLKRSCA